MSMKERAGTSGETVSLSNMMKLGEKGLPVSGTMALVVATNLIDNELVKSQ